MTSKPQLKQNLDHALNAAAQVDYDAIARYLDHRPQTQSNGIHNLSLCLKQASQAVESILNIIGKNNELVKINEKVNELSQNVEDIHQAHRLAYRRMRPLKIHVRHELHTPVPQRQDVRPHMPLRQSYSSGSESSASEVAQDVAQVASRITAMDKIRQDVLKLRLDYEGIRHKI